MAATPRRYVPGPRPNPNNPPPNNHIPGSGMFNNPGHHPGNGQHNNSGGGTQGGNGGKKSRRHPSGPLYKQARNDVTLANRPYLDAIHQAQIQARQQYAQDAARVKSIYGALGSQLAPLSAQ